MKRSLRYLLLALVVTLFVVHISCREEDDDKTDVVCDVTQRYQLEYDHMVGYDPFLPPGETHIRLAFSEGGAWTQLMITESDDDIPAEEWPYQELGAYMRPYMTREITPGVGEVLSYKSYLIAIQDASGNPPEPEGYEMVGVTYYKGQEGVTNSAIFMQAIRDNHPDDEMMEFKVTIHEMGHARAALTHLCDEQDPNIQNPDHDADDCVMGKGKIASCTGMDLTILLHFCPACRDKIKKVTW